MAVTILFGQRSNVLERADSPGLSSELTGEWKSHILDPDVVPCLLPLKGGHHTITPLLLDTPESPVLLVA